MTKRTSTHARSAPGLKTLLTMAAVAATLAGWAGLAGQAKQPATAPVEIAAPAAPSEGLRSVTRPAALLLALATGAAAAVAVLPVWLPGLSASLLGSDPKAAWYLARASGLVAYGLLWLAMLSGLLITSRTAKLWPGGPLAFDLHQHASLLALAFSLFHGLVLLGDQYIGYTLAQVLIPFASTGYKPLAVGAGQIALYVLALVALSFYVKQQPGRQVWRLIHYASFVLFGLALLHGIASGSDGGAWWAQALYWLSGGSVLFLTVYRVLVLRPGRRATQHVE